MREAINAGANAILPIPLLLREGPMSRRNGDKARFGRQHFRKVLLRKQMRELRKLLTGKIPEPASLATRC